MINYKEYDKARDRAIKALLNYSTKYMLRFNVHADEALDAARLVLEKAVVDVE